MSANDNLFYVLKGQFFSNVVFLESIACNFRHYLSCRICSRISVISALKCCISMAFNASACKQKVKTLIMVRNGNLFIPEHE